MGEAMCAKQMKNHNSERKAKSERVTQGQAASETSEESVKPEKVAPVSAKSETSEESAKTETSEESGEPEALEESVETKKVESVVSTVEKDEMPEKTVSDTVAEQNKVVELRSKFHRKVFSTLWWLILAIIVGLLGGVALWGYFTNQPDDMAVVDDEISDPAAEPFDDEPSDESEQTPETALPEETPTEPEKSAESQTLAEPQSQSISTSLSARPNNAVEPDVVPGHKVIALTFDDGPSSATTPRLLDILKSKDIKVTFFVLGTMAQRSPDLLRREVSEGHEVASHTPYHNQLTNLTWDQVHAEAVEMDQIFQEILGTVPPFTRPPYGSYNATVSSALGQPLILWSIDPRDWADRNASTVCSRVTSAAFDGAIILVHDIHATTVDAVPCIVDNLYAQGYQFLTVSELAAYKNVPLVNGVAYGKF